MDFALVLAPNNDRTREKTVSISFYDASLGTYLQLLEGIGGVLEKGAAHAAETGLDLKEVVAEAREALTELDKAEVEALLDAPAFKPSNSAPGRFSQAVPGSDTPDAGRTASASVSHRRSGRQIGARTIALENPA